MKTVRCPLCKSEAKWEENPYRPFCSKECKSKDLGNWATERYKIEATEEIPGDPATPDGNRDSK